MFVEFSKNVFNKVYIAAMLYGSMSDEQASHAAQRMMQAFPGEAYPESEHYEARIAMLSNDRGPFFVEGQSGALGNAALLGLEYPAFSFKARGAQQILNQGMREPFFAQLRTKQQTGYIVYNNAEDLEKHLFSFLAVQSNTHDVRDLLARFELFLEGYLQELTREIPEERFEVLRQSVIENVLNSVKNIQTMGELLNILAFKHDGDFKWMEKRLAGLKELTYNEFLSFVQELVGKGNKRRLAILMKGTVPEQNFLQYKKLMNVEQLKKTAAFEAGDEIQ
jgi:insulysin